MGERTFRFHSPAMAIHVEDGQPSVVTIPEKATVTLVEGDITGTRFVKIRYMEQVLEIFAGDLRRYADLVFVKSA